MKHLSILFLLAFFSVTAFAQVQIDSVQQTICGNSSVVLSATSSGSQHIDSTTFDNHMAGPGWSTTGAAPAFNNPCGPGKNSWHLWVGATQSTSRAIETPTLDLSSGPATVGFWMRYGRVQGQGLCEDPDAPDEGVHLQYSTDGGLSWADFPGPNTEPVGNLNANPPFTTSTPGSGGYWTPHSISGHQQGSELYFWNKYECQVPQSALTSATKFRWAQIVTSSTGFDTWGLDEIEIVYGSINPDSVYEWTGSKTGLSNISYTFPSKNYSYDTTIYVVNNNDPYDKDSITFTVLPRAISTFSIPGDSSCVDVPLHFEYTGPQQSNLTYQWSIDQKIINNTSAFLDTTFSTAGTHSITLKTDNGTCQDMTMKFIYLYPGFQMPSYSISPAKSCAPAKVNFDINSGNYDIRWMFSPVLYSTQDHAFYVYQNPGTYHPKLVISDPSSGCEVELDLEVIIGEKPSAKIVAAPASASPGTTIYYGNVSTVNDTLQTITDHLYEFGDGTTSTLQNPTHIYTATGDYYPKLTITTNFGCQESDSMLVQISQVSINELADHGITVYPVPASEHLFIEAEHQLPEQVSLYDVNGRLIRSIKPEPNITRQIINLSGFASGTYFIEIRMKDKILRSKIMKE